MAKKNLSQIFEKIEMVPDTNENRDGALEMVPDTNISLNMLMEVIDGKKAKV